MQNSFRAAATAALLLTAVQPAHGQGFLGRLAERARQKVEEQAEQIVSGAVGAGQGATAGSSEGTSSSSSSAPAVMTPKAVRGAAPRADAPASAPSPAPASKAEAAGYPSDLPRPAGFDKVKAAFDAFGKVDCSSCEGGYGFDSWPSFPRDGYSGKYNESGKRLGALPVGHVHRWKGVQSTGTLTVLAEETVGGFRCKRLQYKLVKNKASAERPGLVCWGYANSFAGSEGWNEVY